MFCIAAILNYCSRYSFFDVADEVLMEKSSEIGNGWGLCWGSNLMWLQSCVFVDARLMFVNSGS